MTISIQGASNNIYNFDCFDFSVIPNSISHCVYIYINQKSIYPDIQYVGMTTRRLIERHQEHENDGKYECAINHGANSIGIHTCPTSRKYSESELKAIEEDILKRYTTPCNIQNN